MTLSDIPKSNLDMADRLESGKELTQVERAYMCGFLHALDMVKNIKIDAIKIKEDEDEE